MQFHPVIADGGLSAGALFVIVAVVVIVGGGLLYWLFKEYYGLTLNPSATSMVQYQRVTVSATLQKKTWRFGTWANVGGSYTVTINAASAILGPTPTSGTTTAAAPTAAITVVGTNPGTDTLTVSFTIAGSTAAISGGIALTVTPG